MHYKHALKFHTMLAATGRVPFATRKRPTLPLIRVWDIYAAGFREYNSSIRRIVQTESFSNLSLIQV